jgi:hypothetical protein
MAELDGTLLAAWLAQASTGDPQRVEAIRAGTAQLSDGTVAETLDMVLLAHGIPQVQAAERLSLAIAEHEPAFNGQAAYLQTQVAAAWTVAQTLHVGSNLAVAAALAVASARFCGLHPQGPELYAMSVANLRELQQTSRGRPELPKGKGHRTVVSDEIAAAGGITGPQLKEVADALSMQVTALVRTQVAIVDALNQRLAAADEEINTLWWTLSGRQGGDGENWGELGPAAPLLAGMNLAEMTVFATPPPWARALLHHVLIGIGGYSIDQAVAALPSGLILGHAATHALLPVSCAVSGSPSPFSIGARVVSAPELAEQMLFEGLLGRLL